MSSAGALAVDTPRPPRAAFTFSGGTKYTDLGSSSLDWSRMVKCVVEIPKGSRNKYEYDHDFGGIKLDRFLSSSVVYPDRLRLHPGDPLGGRR